MRKNILLVAAIFSIGTTHAMEKSIEQGKGMQKIQELEVEKSEEELEEEILRLKICRVMTHLNIGLLGAIPGACIGAKNQIYNPSGKLSDFFIETSYGAVAGFFTGCLGSYLCTKPIIGRQISAKEKQIRELRTIPVVKIKTD